MAAAYVRDTGKVTVSPGASASASFASLPAVGNHVIAFASSQISSFNTNVFTDNQSNSYAADADVFSGGNGKDEATIGSAKVATSSGTFTVTVTRAGSPYYLLCAVEFSGLASASWLDKTGTGNGTTGANVATVTASGANSQAAGLACAMVTVGGSSATMGFSTPSGYTEIVVDNDATAHDVGEGAYKITSGVETSSAAWNHATAAAGYGWAAVVATYKAASSSGGTFGRSITQIGQAVNRAAYY